MTSSFGPGFFPASQPPRSANPSGRGDGPATVADLLELPELRRGRPRVVAGASGLGRVVRWVHVAEVPDIASLLSGGELLLTTGVELPTDDAGLVRYIDELADVEVAALVVETVRRFAQLPRALVAAAQRRGLPLVQLECETPFVRVTEAAHARIIDARVRQLEASERVSETFTQLAVDGASDERLVAEMARLAERPVVLETLARQVIAFAEAGVDAAELLEGWARRSWRVPLVDRTTYVAAHAVLTTKVGARGEGWGRLVLLGAERAVPYLTLVLERGAAALALNRLVDRARESEEHQAHAGVVRRILDQSYTSDREVYLRADSLGVPLRNRTLVACVVRLLPDAEAGCDEEPAACSPPRAVDLAVRVTRDLGVPTLVSAREPAELGLVVSLDPEEGVDAALARLSRRLRAGLAPLGRVVIGVGPPVASVTAVRTSFHEAAQVAAVATTPGTADRPYHRLGDLQLRGLLHQLRDDPRLQAYVERELGPLLAYDDAHGGDLLATLTTWLTSGGNKAAAATAAHVSRPTLYQRLRVCERVLGVDLDDVDAQVSLHVAALAHEALVAARGSVSPPARPRSPAP